MRCLVNGFEGDDKIDDKIVRVGLMVREKVRVRVRVRIRLTLIVLHSQENPTDLRSKSSPHRRHFPIHRQNPVRQGNGVGK